MNRLKIIQNRKKKKKKKNIEIPCFKKYTKTTDFIDIILTLNNPKCIHQYLFNSKIRFQ